MFFIKTGFYSTLVVNLPPMPSDALCGQASDSLRIVEAFRNPKRIRAGHGGRNSTFPNDGQLE
jgi:hypothetical protein